MIDIVKLAHKPTTPPDIRDTEHIKIDPRDKELLRHILEQLRPLHTLYMYDDSDGMFGQTLFWADDFGEAT